MLKLPKTTFLCSRKVPASIVLKCYDWAIEQREAGNCIISGFHSQIERDVLHYLLKGTQPIILALARGLKKHLEQILNECMLRRQKHDCQGVCQKAQSWTHSLTVVFLPFLPYAHSKYALRKLGLNERQIKAVFYVVNNGSISNGEYQKLNNTSDRTALRDLEGLVSMNILIKKGQKKIHSLFSFWRINGGYGG